MFRGWLSSGSHSAPCWWWPQGRNSCPGLECWPNGGCNFVTHTHTSIFIILFSSFTIPTSSSWETWGVGWRSKRVKAVALHMHVRKFTRPVFVFRWMTCMVMHDQSCQNWRRRQSLGKVRIRLHKRIRARTHQARSCIAQSAQKTTLTWRTCVKKKRNRNKKKNCSFDARVVSATHPCTRMYKYTRWTYSLG